MEIKKPSTTKVAHSIAIKGQYARDDDAKKSTNGPQSYLTASATGEYKRATSGHRHIIAPGSRFEPEVRMPSA
jgi:hypothetical protein